MTSIYDVTASNCHLGFDLRTPTHTHPLFHSLFTLFVGMLDVRGGNFQLKMKILQIFLNWTPIGVMNTNSNYLIVGHQSMQF